MLEINNACFAFFFVDKLYRFIFNCKLNFHHQDTRVTAGAENADGEFAAGQEFFNQNRLFVLFKKPGADVYKLFFAGDS